MKKILSLILFLILLSGFLFASLQDDYLVLANKDESDNNLKIYGVQYENSEKWKGIEITSSTIKYVKGDTIEMYNTWWTERKSPSTTYRDGFTYKKYNYPN